MGKGGVARVQGEGFRNGTTPDDIPDGFIIWGEYMDAWRQYHSQYGSESAMQIESRGGFSYKELKIYLGHNPTTWEPRDLEKYKGFERKPEDMPEPTPEPPIEPVYSHIWYGTGEVSICVSPVVVPEVPVLFDASDAPSCKKCFDLMFSWLEWWDGYGKKE